MTKTTNELLKPPYEVWNRERPDIRIKGLKRYPHCPVPESEAKTLDLGDYEVSRKKPSEFIVGKMVDDGYDFICPRCHKLAENKQDHGVAFSCGYCGLNRQSFGSALYIWDE